MASTTIRWDVTKHLIDIIRTQFNDLQIEPGFPGDRLEAESVWIDELDGEIEIPVMSAGRKYRDDRFTIPFEIRVAGKSDLDSTMERLAEIVAGIEDVMADDPGLDDFDGLLSAEVASERMTAGELKGAGWVGFGEVIVSCHARME